MDTLPVIVAVDGSPDSERALHWAIEAARLRSAPLQVVHAWPYASPPEAAVTATGEGDPVLDELRGKLVRRGAGGGLPEITFRGLSGLTDTVLPALGDEAQLLVLGSRGRGGFASLLLGSNGLACAAHSAAPVVVVPRPDRGGAPGHAAEQGTSGGDALSGGALGADTLGGEARRPAAGRITLGIDATSDEPGAIGFAFEEASRRAARLDVVCGYSWPMLTPPAFEYTAAYEGTQQEYEDALAKRLAEALAPYRDRHPEVAVEITLRDADAAGQLVEASKDSDLLVVARHRRRLPVGRRLGSVTHAVLLHALCPIAVVPAPAAGPPAAPQP
ncbi:universal stress protein [Streptomyces sp. MST-110588]|uniref:universal stress protein n=1 Tax=Streptomyces sp. MST-110588 TaxID=2833628 RepID=UPI001F5D3519|nr:universal stress protein [Streptomyces sp. MST-110588]UNO44203.1 universal stress protein [Streptomyces sp. MST-110588]